MRFSILSFFLVLLFACKKEEPEPVNYCYPDEIVDEFSDIESYHYFEHSTDSSKRYSHIESVFLNGEELDLGGYEMAAINSDGCDYIIKTNKNIFDIYYGDILELNLHFISYYNSDKIRYNWCGSGGVKMDLPESTKNALFNVKILMPSNRFSRTERGIDFKNMGNGTTNFERGERILILGGGFPYLRYNYIDDIDERCY